MQYTMKVLNRILLNLLGGIKKKTWRGNRQMNAIVRADEETPEHV